MKEIYEEVTNQSKMMYEAQKEEIFNNTLKENKKLKQEIKRLKEEYVMLQNASDEVEEEKDKEIERLNNIILELEKFIDEEYRYYNKRNYPTFGACMGALNRVNDKLQELKGVDKE